MEGGLMFYRLVCWVPNSTGEEADVVTWMETSLEESAIAWGGVYAQLCPDIIVMLEKVE